jgi:hypothetical protein
MIDADWSSIESSSDDVNAASYSFYNISYKILNDHVPKYKNKKHNYPVWFTPQIIKNVQIKNKLRRRYMKFKNPEDLVSFRELRGSIKSDISQAYKDFVASSERNINENPKKFWLLPIEIFLRQKRRGTGLPSCMSIGKSTISGPVNIVDAFAEFFQSIYSDRAAVYTKFDSANHNNISLCSVPADEVFQSIKRTKSNYVHGPEIPAFFVKDCASVLLQPMFVLFNLCIKTGTFPEIWKISKILPTHKAKDRSVIENYRPILIINNFAKIFESLISDQLYIVLSKLISPSQHGFMRGRPTTTQLISDSIDKGFQTDVVYLDFSKAFDSLDHNILVQKLWFVGASPMLVKFFCSYLQGRKQYVHCYGYDSASINVTSGVPQGSVLGLLLFLVFINDIGDKLTVPFFLFADDAKLLKQISEWSDCVTLQANLDEIMNWCTINKLSLNIKKCQVILFFEKGKYQIRLHLKFESLEQA